MNSQQHIKLMGFHLPKIQKVSLHEPILLKLRTLEIKTF